MLAGFHGFLNRVYSVLTWDCPPDRSLLGFLDAQDAPATFFEADFAAGEREAGYGGVEGFDILVQPNEPWLLRELGRHRPTIRRMSSNFNF